MRFGLLPHPESSPAAVQRVDVEVGRLGPRALEIRYLVSGRIEALAIPPAATPTRTDELWRHTCLEAFLKPPGEDAYVEINLSPSGQWAAYRFDAYRSGMRPLAPFGPPAIAVDVKPGTLELRAELTVPAGGPLRLGLSAVIEARDGSRSYWALAHPPGAPDFHHADCFAAQL